MLICEVLLSGEKIMVDKTICLMRGLPMYMNNYCVIFLVQKTVCECHNLYWNTEYIFLVHVQGNIISLKRFAQLSLSPMQACFMKCWERIRRHGAIEVQFDLNDLSYEKQLENCTFFEDKIHDFYTSIKNIMRRKCESISWKKCHKNVSQNNKTEMWLYQSFSSIPTHITDLLDVSIQERKLCTNPEQDPILSLTSHQYDSLEKDLIATVILPESGTEKVAVDSEVTLQVKLQGNGYCFNVINDMCSPVSLEEGSSTQKHYINSDKSKMFGSFINNTNVTQIIDTFPVLQYSLEQTFALQSEGLTPLTNPEVIFSNYFARLSTLHNLDQDHIPSALKLAKAGFYSTGIGDETACFHCGCRYAKWCKEDDPVKIHEDISPGCEFINAIIEPKESNLNIPHSSPIHEQTSEKEDKTSISVIVYGDETYMRMNEAAGKYNIQNTSSPTSKDNKSINSPEEIHENLIHGMSDKIYHPTEVREKNDKLPLTLQSLSLDNARSFNDSSKDVMHQVEDQQNSLKSVSECSSLYSSSQKGAVDETHLQWSTTTSPEKIQRGYKQDFKSPLFPRYQSLLVRISTFAKWPPYLPQSAREMALAGFYYKGYSDTVVCFWCGVVAINWKYDDEPEIEHAKLQPSCPYMIQTKGQIYINIVQNELKKPKDRNIPFLSNNAAEKDGDVCTYKRLREMGFQRDQIATALNKCSHLTGKVNPDENDIVDEILKNQTEQHQSRLPSTVSSRQYDNTSDQSLISSSGSLLAHSKTEKHQDNEQPDTAALLTCKICMTEEVKVTFLPCGHLVCCFECSQMVSICPVCRANIVNRVKSYIS